MNNLFKQLKDELEKIKEEVLGIVLYGSYAENKTNEKSDIDVCVVIGSKKKEKIDTIFRKILRIAGRSKKYDIKIFELMPLWLKIEVIKKGKILYTKDSIELSYYFYFYRKLWESQAIQRIKI